MQKYASVPRLLAALQGSGVGGVLASCTPSPAVAELASSLADAAPSPLLGILRRSPFLATFATSPLAKAPLGLPPLQGSYVQSGAASQQVAAKVQNFAKTDTRAMSGHASGVASEAIGMTDGEAVKRAALPGLMLTIALGLVFTCCQAFEYWEAALTIADGYYGTAFYMATGFHGLHVIMGTVFLIITAARMSRGQFAPSHHVGFQLAAWYWHFVDVVWLFVLVSFYDF